MKLLDFSAEIVCNKKTSMAAKVITAFNQKGRFGKTTVAMSLAGAMSKLSVRFVSSPLDFFPVETFRLASTAPYTP